MATTAGQPALGLVVALALGCGGSGLEPRPVEPAPLPVAEERAEPDPPPAGRLGDDVVPRRAALEVTLDPRSERFAGRVEYQIDIARPVSAIWLNAAGLRLGRAELIDARGSRPLTWVVAGRGRPELVGLAIGRRVGPGRARLRLEYSGPIGERSGLFRQRLAGQWYAYTDFEPTDARTALPAFDDPKFKIRWQVTLRVPAHLSAFSNTAPVREDRAGKRDKLVAFAETRPLPSYLLSFAAGPFEVAQASAKSSVPVRVIVPRGLRAHADEALKAAPRLLQLAEEYMGSRSPYDKLDFIAVPEFNGAMENPGLVTVAAGILLVNPADPPGEERSEHLDLLHGVLAHEIAHYWFGDLVTMRYWDELWLNEGLATWMSDWMVVALAPGLRGGKVVEIVDKARAVRLDRRTAPRPVRFTPRSVAEIGEQFGPMSYRKGGAIAAMFEALIGREANRAALHEYVAAHADGSVTSGDLAKAWSTAAGQDLGPALRSFVDQPGIPVVSAALECKAGKAAVALRQEPYRAPLAARRPATRWQVPVCVAWAGGRAPVCTLVAGESGSLALPAAGCPAWIHPNPGERGYYLYTLPADQLRALARSGSLTAREQAGLADDIDTLLRSGQIELGTALDALAILAAGRDRLTAIRTLEILTLVGRSVVEPRARKRYATLLAPYAPLLREVGVTGTPRDGELTAQVRRLLVTLAARDGNDTALQRRALRALDAWLKRTPGEREAAIDSDLLTAAAAPLGGAALYDRILALNEGRVQPALAAFRQPALVARSLAAVNEDKVPVPAAIELLARLVADPISQPQALPVALARYGELAGRLADTDRAVSARVFAGVCRAESRAAVASALTGALGDKQGALPPAAQFVLEAIDECIAFRRLHQASAAAYLK